MCIGNINSKPKDVISQKYYNNHICNLGAHSKFDFHNESLDLVSFCQAFRSVKMNHILMINDTELKMLRTELEVEQGIFKKYQKRIEERSIYFYSRNRYNWIECNNESPKPTAQLLSSYYIMYAVRMTTLQREQIFQIYHGCQPTKERPPEGFSFLKDCKTPA